MKWLMFVIHSGAGPWSSDTTTHYSLGDIADKWFSSVRKTSGKVINASITVDEMPYLLCSSEIRNPLLARYSSKWMCSGCIWAARFGERCGTAQRLLSPAAFTRAARLWERWPETAGARGQPGVQALARRSGLGQAGPRLLRPQPEALRWEEGGTRWQCRFHPICPALSGSPASITPW